MKNISIGIVLFVIGGLLFSVLAPAYMKDKFSGIITFASNERKCFNFYKVNFSDPDTAYVENSHISHLDNRYLAILSKEYEEMIHVKVRMKNQVGAYDSDYVSCPLVDGKFNERAAVSYKLIFDNFLDNGTIPDSAFQK